MASIRCARGTAWLALLVGLGACAPGTGGDDGLGVLTVALTEAPADVYCIRIEVIGTRAVVSDHDTTPGTSTDFSLRGLPLGPVLVSGEAFGVACDLVGPTSVPGWVSDPVEATLATGAVASVTLAMRRNGRADVNVDFQEDPACLAQGSPCAAAAQCCSLTCELGSCVLAPTCSAGLTSCGGTCVDLASDPMHCGACGMGCPLGSLCQSGMCAPSLCAGSEVLCGATCANLATDPQNCGACGITCLGGGGCIAGTCSATCVATPELCNGFDDDCDAATADGSADPNVGLACDGPGDSDFCLEGTTVCTAGGIACADLTSDTLEICVNGIDDNCDGLVDEGCFYVIAASASSLTEVQVYFSDLIAASSAVPDAFVISGGPVPVSVSSVAVFTNSLMLTTSTLTEGVTYTVFVATSVTSTTGVPVASGGQSATFSVMLPAP